MWKVALVLMLAGAKPDYRINERYFYQTEAACKADIPTREKELEDRFAEHAMHRGYDYQFVVSCFFDPGGDPNSL